MTATRPSLLVIAALVAGAAGRAEAQRAAHAVKLYKEGNYEAAYEAFHTLVLQRGADPTLLYDGGDALYRLGRYSEAAANFAAVIPASPALAERAYYNLGTAYLKAADSAQDRHGVLLRAFQAFQQALLRDPGDRDAKWNLEVAFRRVAAEEEAHNPGPTGHADWGRGNLTKSGYGGRRVANTAPGGAGAGGRHGLSAPRLSQEQARRLLKEFREKHLATGPRPATSDTAGTGGRNEW